MEWLAGCIQHLVWMGFWNLMIILSEETRFYTTQSYHTLCHSLSFTQAISFILVSLTLSVGGLLKFELLPDHHSDKPSELKIELISQIFYFSILVDFSLYHLFQRGLPQSCENYCLVSKCWIPCYMIIWSPWLIRARTLFLHWICWYIGEPHGHFFLCGLHWV